MRAINRDLGSLRFFCSSSLLFLPRTTVFSGLTRVRSSSFKVPIEAEHKGVYTEISPKCSNFAQQFQDVDTLFSCPETNETFPDDRFFQMILSDAFVHFRSGCAPCKSQRMAKMTPFARTSLWLRVSPTFRSPSFLTGNMLECFAIIHVLPLKPVLVVADSD